MVWAMAVEPGNKGSHISGGRGGEGVVHAVLDGQPDIRHIQLLLLCVLRVHPGVF